METLRDYTPIHLLAEKSRVASDPRLRMELEKSVVVQIGEQRPRDVPGWSVGVLVYLRQDGHLLPERLDPIVYLACVQSAVDAILRQAMEVASRLR